MNSFVTLCMFATIFAPLAISADSIVNDVTYMYGYIKNPAKDKPNLADFRYKDCGESSAQLKGWVNITPNSPLVVPGSATLSFDATLSREVPSPIKAEILVQRKVLFWWLTMFYGVFDDVCSLFPRQPSGCPPPFGSLPSCQCPLKPGRYAMNRVPVVFPEIPPSRLPSWLFSGEYYVQIELVNDYTELGCGEIYVDLQID